MEPVTPDRVIVEANKFIGVPFCHKGRSILGLDCLGLIIVAFRNCGILIPSDDGFSYNPIWWRKKEERLHSHLLKYGFEEVQNPQRGDIITFRLFGKSYPAHHCGFFIGNDQMLHTRGDGNDRDRRTRVELIGRAYSNRIASHFRYKGFF